MQNIIRCETGAEEVLKQNCLGELEYLTFPALSKIEFVKHLFTTRTGGVSTGDCSSLNLSFSRGDDPGAVLENYRRLCQVFGMTVDDVVASAQTHTCNIRVTGREDCGKGVVKPQDYGDVDGLITKESNVLLTCFFADCVPLYFVDPVNRAIGLAHSGWKGTIQGMGACMIKAMEESFGSKAKDLIVAVGPSICRDCYEVSEDVADLFQQRFGGSGVVTPGKKEGKYQLDLWLANQLILMQAGVPREQISVTDVCTCHNPGYLFSHRASNGKRGNLAACLMIAEEER